VVENDSLMPNKDLVESLGKDFPVPVIYGFESNRGIASTRNRSVQLAGSVDFIAFIDDDEIADPHWLDELIAVQYMYGADVVTGPVLPSFERPPSSWALKGRFYDRPRYPTGTEMRFCGAGNVLVKGHWLTEVKKPFDGRLNLTGSEDTLFFNQIYRQGAKIIWADEACVTEFIPPTRVSVYWLIMREFREGINYSTFEIMIGSSFVLLMIRALKGVLHIVIGLLLVLFAWIHQGYVGFIHGLMTIGRGVGQLCGLLGLRYEGYKHIHGN
jgi:succinoglycan biosynthesis protein ExoM